jgi:hypothetical protein
LTFADDLVNFPLADIEAGLLSISSRRRAEGETAFPDIATVLDEVRAAGRIRRVTEARVARMAEEAAERKHREEHPEDFEPLGPSDLEAMAKKLGDKFSFERPKARAIPEPVTLCCPKCSYELAVPENTRFWTAEQHRAHADTLDELQRMADKNRGAA